MGPSGCGKSTLGRELARLAGVPFVDADDFHTEAAVAKMARGEGLDDEDRAPWLARLAHRLDQAESSGLVLACSALKERYRRALGLEHPRRFLVYLRVPTEELARRLEVRTGHYAGPSLLASQLRALEAPLPSETFDGTGSPSAIAASVLSRTGFPLDGPAKAD